MNVDVMHTGISVSDPPIDAMVSIQHSRFALVLSKNNRTVKVVTSRVRVTTLQVRESMHSPLFSA